MNSEAESLDIANEIIERLEIEQIDAPDRPLILTVAASAKISIESMAVAPIQISEHALKAIRDIITKKIDDEILWVLSLKERFPNG